MIIRSFTYRLIGLFWLGVGLLVGGLGLAYALVSARIDAALRSQFPDLTPIVSEVVSSLIPDWLIVWAILFGGLTILLGINLAALKSWARPIAIAFHLLIGIYLMGLTVTVYVLLTDVTGPVASDSTREAATYVLVVGLALALVGMIIGFSLFSESAQATFAGVPSTPPELVGARCPTCGKHNLNLQNGSCPSCDRERELAGVMAARLVDLDNGTVHNILLRRRTVIGRDRLENDVRLASSSVSQPHAYIEYEDGRFMVFDQGSTNGTFVGANKVRFAEIHSGDAVQFGRMRFRFEVEYAKI